MLDDVNFTIRRGEFTGLIGSNGAGKTTLFRVILGLQSADSRAGQLAVGADARRNRIGYVPQKFLLDPDMPVSARDLVALGLDGHRLGLARPSRARRALSTRCSRRSTHAAFADTRVGRLSGGEQQRILIAHALISRPRLLLLDEPLANLDLRSGQEVVDAARADRARAADRGPDLGPRDEPAAAR